ncbi:hypothetical protein JHK87_048421 [Glycine soja]|nr:hypothetical protein JHK87_048421 [Glycine soja]
MLSVLCLFPTLTIKPCRHRTSVKPAPQGGGAVAHHCDGPPLPLMGILDEEQEREGEQSTVMRSRLVALVGVIDWFYDALRDWSLFQALEGKLVGSDGGLRRGRRKREEGERNLAAIG